MNPLLAILTIVFWFTILAWALMDNRQEIDALRSQVQAQAKTIAAQSAKLSEIQPLIHKLECELAMRLVKKSGAAMSYIAPGAREKGSET